MGFEAVTSETVCKLANFKRLSDKNPISKLLTSKEQKKTACWSITYKSDFCQKIIYEMSFYIFFMVSVLVPMQI